MTGNIYSKGNKRLKVIKKIAYNYYTCKEWFNGNNITVSLTTEQINQLNFICTI